MKYPRRNPYLRFQRSDGGMYYVRDYLTEEEYDFPAEIAEELLQMDGTRAMGEYFPELSDEEWRAVVRFLEEEELVVYGRVSSDLPGVHTIGLWFGGGERMGSGSAAAACALHLLVRLLWLPLLVYGVPHMLIGDISMRGGIGQLIAGLVLGLLLGITFHELSHAASAVRYGALVYEIGVGILLLMPAGYVVYDTKMVRSRRKQIHIFLAGVRMNFLLMGLSVILAGVYPDAGIFFYFFGRTNLLLGLLNLSICGPLDGRRVLMRLLNFPEDWSVFDLWSVMRGETRVRGYCGLNGRMMQTAAFVLIGFHLMYGLMMGLELWGMVGLFL